MTCLDCATAPAGICLAHGGRLAHVLADFGSQAIRDAEGLARYLAGQAEADVLRVFAAAGVELIRRRPFLTPEDLAAGIRESADWGRRQGLV